MAAAFVVAAKTNQIPRNGLVALDVDGVAIAVANVAGVFYAFEDTCTHEQCSLSQGDLSGTTVTCMCHGAEFDVRNGRVLAPPAPLPVQVYRTKIDGDNLLIEV
jgi:nitrite reductase/ring-hydroxylating ferredoxin subunit